MNLRPYQKECVEAVLSSLGKGRFRELVVIPTGGGKTILFSTIAQAIQPKRTLILCHREELINQAVDKIRAATGMTAQIEKASYKASLKAPIVVGSVQTMRGRRIKEWPVDHFDLVVCDEAHRSVSAQWQATLARFHDHASVLGVTATPDRADGKNLGGYYDRVAYEIGILDLINQGYLAGIKIKRIPVKIDLSNVKKAMGDLDAATLSDAVEPAFRAILNEVGNHAAWLKTLVFLPLRETSRKFAALAREEGFPAEHIDGESPDRKEILARFASGETMMLCNPTLLTEGYDQPDIECILNLRATQSRALYCQMIGRGTRLASGKKEVLVLDPLWVSKRHSLVKAAELLTTDPVEAEIVEDAMAGQCGREIDLIKALSEVGAKREAKLAEILKRNADKKTEVELIDAEAFIAANAPQLLTYKPAQRWESDPVTESQARLLKRNGIDPATVESKGAATQLIAVAVSKFGLDLKAASEGQKRIMRQAGVENWETATAKQAREFFQKLRGKRTTKIGGLTLQT